MSYFLKRWKTSCKWRTCSSRVLLLTTISSICTSTVRPTKGLKIFVISLINDASVFESERHDFVAIKTMWRYEGYLFFVSRGHEDLVVSGEGVQEGEHPLPSNGIHNLIYPWQRETVFWAYIIEVGVIDAHPPFAFLFGYHHYICQPVRVLHFSDEFGFQQLVYFIQDNFLPVQVKTSNPLPDGSGCWQDVKLMRGNGGMNSLHIRMCPCEDIMVLYDGVLHVMCLFCCQEGTDIRKVSTFFRNLDRLQGIYCRGIFVRRTQ